MQTVLAQDHCIQFPKLMLGGSQLAVTQAPEDPKSVASAGTCTQTYINKITKQNLNELSKLIKHMYRKSPLLQYMIIERLWSL